MSDNPVGIPMPLTDIETFKLKCQRTVTGSPKLCFSFINTLFDKTFIFKKNVLLGILMLTNAKEKKILKFAQSVSQNIIFFRHKLSSGKIENPIVENAKLTFGFKS